MFTRLKGIFTTLIPKREMTMERRKNAYSLIHTTTWLGKTTIWQFSAREVVQDMKGVNLYTYMKENKK